MFNYPISIPKKTLYRDLGVGPEANDQEIGDAHGALVRKLEKTIGEAQNRLDIIYEQVPGLKESVKNVEQLDAGSSDESTADEARKKLLALEREAGKIDSEYQALKDRIHDTQQHRSDVNRINLRNQEQQREYDEAHPPLDLLKLERNSNNPFANDELNLDQRVALFATRRELAAFLAEQGEAVFHPSDLGRDDFSADYTYNPLLDGPEE